MTTPLRDQLQTSLGSAYALERELGGGGMSRVFVADETRLGRKVVVKVLAPELAAGISAERFERELRMAASLQQANIVPVLAAGDTGGLPFYTMPYVEGESLRARLTQAGALSVTEAVGILRDVARALAYAHGHGVVHRDIKPDNVLLSGGTAVVTDFGIAKALSISRTLAPGPTLTQAGTSIGTPAYMAPEQAAGDPEVDHRADLYAFGCLAYELLAGHPPFPDRSPHRVLAAHMGERPQPVGELRLDVPPALAAMVMACLEKEPTARPQSAAEVVRALEAITSGSSHTAMPTVLRGGRGMLERALLLYVGAFGVVAVVARAAVIALGLPDWVVPGALGVMLLGLPVILFTGYVHYATHRAVTATPRVTPGGTPAPVRHGTLATLAVKASPWVSWRRSTLGGAYALGAFAVLVAGFMLLRALGIGPPGSLLASGALRERERLLVTDFRVRGADSSLGTVAAEAVRTELGQSSVIAVVPTSAVGAALERMRRPPTTRVDLALGHEIAEREGIKAIVDGEITPLGGGFVITLRLIATDRHDELASFHEAAETPRDLLPALDRLTRKLRGKIGESLRAVREAPPLEEVTTSSLAALRKYTAGARANDIEGNAAKAATLLQEAVALDTEFAMGWRKLGMALNNGGMPRERVDDALARAYRYRGRLTDAERAQAIAAYYFSGPGRDRARAIAAYEDILARDSTDATALNNLALLLFTRREFARAAVLLRRAIASPGGGVLEYGNLARFEVNAGNMAAAESTIVAARRMAPGSPSVEGLEIPSLYARGRLDSTAGAIERLRLSSDEQNRVTGTYLAAQLAAVRGRLAQASRLFAEARVMNATRGVALPDVVDSVTESWIDIQLRGTMRAGVARLDAALTRVPLRSLPLLPPAGPGGDPRPYPFRVATLYAVAGRPDRARALLAQYDGEVMDTTRRRDEEPFRHNLLAEIALAENRATDALAEFRRGDLRPDGPANPCAPCLFVELGRAYDHAGVPDSAITMFERYLTTPFVGRLAPWVDPSHLGAVYERLGELYEAQGDPVRADSYYAKLVALWKDADAELQPRVARARRRQLRLTEPPAR